MPWAGQKEPPGVVPEVVRAGRKGAGGARGGARVGAGGAGAGRVGGAEESSGGAAGGRLGGQPGGGNPVSEIPEFAKKKFRNFRIQKSESLQKIQIFA